ncbi:DUF6338 family protein [Patulibacter sp. S7RM1-6]
MSPPTGTALILLVAFVLPGFVTVLLQERTFKRADAPSPFDRLLTSVYYSVWCYLLLAAAARIFGVDRAWIEALIDRHMDDPADLVWRGALCALVPAGVVATATHLWHESGAGKRVQTLFRVNARHQVPTAWDFYFGQRPAVYARVLLSNGKTIVGVYGTHSFAAYAKDGGDLYLQQVVHVEDDTQTESGPSENSGDEVEPNADGGRDRGKFPTGSQPTRGDGGRDDADAGENQSDWLGVEFQNPRGIWLRGDEVVAIKFYALPHDGEAPESWWRRLRGKGTQAAADRPSRAEEPGRAGTTSEAAEEVEVDA